MRALFTFTIFLSAGLLFLVEPMVARMILPVFGGSAQVWNSCMVFFQGALLLGYGYAHLSTKWLGARHQWRLHLPLMVLALAVLLWQGFRAPTSAPSGGDPSFPLLGILAVLIGLPFFVVSAGSSILQKWFASTDDPSAHNPYFLYSASNVGSLLALIAYPVLIEPRLGVRAQTRIWEAGLATLVLAMAACAAALANSDKWSVKPSSGEEPAVHTPGPTGADRARWTLLAAIPSSLMLGVTTYLTTNIAPIPLLWVIPLALYLLTFILAFARNRIVKTEWLSRIMPLIVTPLAMAIILEAYEPLVPLAAFHLVGFFVAAWMCHSILSDSRPAADHLTEFYFWVALGGVSGGVFNALIAPEAFHSLAEYPIAIVAACAVRPTSVDAAKRALGIEMLRDGLARRLGLARAARVTGILYPGARTSRLIDVIYALVVGLASLGAIYYVETHGITPSTTTTMVCIGIPAIFCFLAVDRPIRLGLSLGALFFATSITQITAGGRVLVSARSFFGVHRVTEYGPGGRFFRLTHGNTIHGLQDRLNPFTPLTYYYPTGPIGEAFKVFHGSQKKENVGLVGLGVGSLAAYGEPGQHMDFFEIDPVVRSIATNPKYFTFLRDSKADVRIVMGDARLSLREQPDGRYGMIVLDAFSSDAIPVHLLTEEAFQMYLRKLTPDGVLCVHISNHYLDLSIVVGAIARDLGLKASLVNDGMTDEEKDRGKQPSIWVYVARNAKDFHGLDRDGEPIASESTAPAWTDDFSNVLSVFRPNQ